MPRIKKEFPLIFKTDYSGDVQVGDRCKFIEIAEITGEGILVKVELEKKPRFTRFTRLIRICYAYRLEGIERFLCQG